MNDRPRHDRFRSVVGTVAGRAKKGVDRAQRARQIAHLERAIGRAVYERKRGHSDVDQDIAELMRQLEEVEADHGRL